MYTRTIGKSAALYAAVGIAILALIVAAYAVSQIPKPEKATATVNVAKAVKVPAPGLHYIEAGWVYVDRPAVVQVSVNSSLTWIRLGEYWAQGPTAVFSLGAGNYTLGLLVDVLANGTTLKIDVRVSS